ncbi:hypothetical protein [Microbulbifer pacificus]|uniref:hypothetical protein n=1 Tax=Microbulbifer pacificus TaxID=407164 RepID=UPI000CF3B6C1|nr:hypothetical protein [Microbulbifer pacificus]
MIGICFLTIAALLISLTTQAAEPVSCNIADSRHAVYYRDISQAKFGKEVDIKAVLREKLLKHAKEVERIANWDRKYSGPDEEYIPVLIGILDQSAGENREFSCFWGLVEEGDIVREFTDKEPTVLREGYGLFRKGKLIAYFYSGIGVV